MMRHTLKTAALIAILALSFFANSASALDDGGGRSVFSRGAGERALALGGAYSAVANDPSAMIWNPAGLARLDRKNIYASHTDLIGMGFSEQLGLVALPSWKLGTFGLSFRRFGVDGIEGRDDRGTIYDDNLEDSETQIMLGYGRKIGGIWDVGVAFKYQQHSLAGYSDGAPGLDMGVMVKPLQLAGGKSNLANGVSLGFAIRNLIEPNIRLVEDSVKDPTGLRFGMAYDGDLSKHIHLLLSSDIEKTREMDTRIHAGGEVRLFNLMALRVGSNSGMMTAGAGFRVSNLAVEYTFEDNPLETVHRFGLGMAFGKSTEEKRQASLNAREAELQKQLVGAFMKENNSRIQTILGQAERAIDDGEYQDALQYVETARVLDPGYAGLENMEGEAYFGQGQTLESQGNLAEATIAYQRCLNCSADHTEAAVRLAAVSKLSNLEAARSDVIRKQFEDALEAYAQSDFEKAKNGFTRVLEINPNDKEAAALLKSTMQTLELRADSLIDQANARAQTGNFVEARTILEKVSRMSPGHKDLADATQFVDEQERLQALAQEAAQKAEHIDVQQSSTSVAAPVVIYRPTFAALSAKDQEEVAELYIKGMQAVNKNRHEDAIRYWELVWSKAPDYQQVSENLKQEYLDKGMEAFAEGRLEQSIEIWEKARTVAPDDAKTKGYLARAYEHNSRIREIKGNY